MKIIVNFLVIFILLTTIATPLAARQSNSDIGKNTNDMKNTKFVLLKDRSFPLIDKIIDFLKKIPIINKTIIFFKNLFNFTDSEKLDDYEDKQDLYNIPFYEGDKTDPGKANPTDNSISVKINNFNFDFKKIDNSNNIIEWSFNGDTTGNVVACYWIMVEYFKDGTSTYTPYYWNQPMDSGNIPIGKFYFKGKGPGGNTDWSRFEMYMQIENTYDLDYSYLQFIDQEVLNKEIRDIVLYVRAFSDKELTMWNQDSISVKEELLSDFQEEGMYRPSGDKGNDEKGIIPGIPGFELLFLLIALFLVIIIKKKDYFKK